MDAAGLPLSPADAIDHLSRARHRDHIFETLLNAALTVARRAVLLTVRGDVAIGRFAIGEGVTDPQAVSSASARLGDTGALRDAVTSARPYVGAVEALAPFGIDGGDTAMVLPIQVGDRVVAIVVGPCRPEVDDVAQLADLAPVTGAAGDAIVRLIMRTKARARTVDDEGDSDEPPNLAAQADLYRRNEMWEELAGVLRQQIEAAGSDPDRAALHRRLGHVLTTQLGRDADALEAWERAAELDAYDLDTQRALVRLHRKLDHYDELAEALRRTLRIGMVSETDALPVDEQVRLFAELAEVEGDVLRNDGRALDAWQRLLSIDPNNARALDALEQLYARDDRWEDCAALLERRAAGADDATAAYILLQLADLLERRLDQHERAGEVYERVLQLDPDNAIAAERVPSLLGAQGRWESLVEVLVDRAERADAAGDRIAILQQLAEIYESRLGQPESAVVVAQTAFAEDTADDHLAAELARLASATDSWTSVLADCAALAERLEDDDPDRAFALWLRVGLWYEEPVGSIDDAIHAVQRALRLEPEDAAGLEVLHSLQEQRAAWTDVAVTLRKRAELAGDPHQRAALLLRLADTYEQHLEDTAQATQAYEAALVEDSTFGPAYEALERLYRWDQQWPALADLLRRAIELRDGDDDAAELTRLRLQLGEVLRDHLNATSDAIAVYREVIETDSTNETALAALEALYEGTEQPIQYLELLETQIDAHEPADERVDKYVAAATAWDEQFGRIDRAVACVEKAIAIDASNESALAALARLHEKRADWPAVRDARRALAEAIDHPERRVDALVALGHVCEQRLDAPDDALAAFEEARGINPIEPRVLAGVSRLCEDDPATRDRAAAALELLLETPLLEPAEVASLHFRLGRIAAAGGDADRAQECFVRALAADEAHVPAVDGIADICAEREHWDAAAEALEAGARAAADAADQVRLLMRAAEVARQQLDDPERAAACYAAVLERAPAHVDAARPLAELYTHAERWNELGPVLDTLLDHADLDRDERARLHHRAAQCAENAGDVDAALAHYDRSFDADPAFVPTLVGRADLMFSQQRWDDAARAYQRLAIQHVQNLERADAASVYYRLGVARRELGEGGKATAMFEKAVALYGGHRDALAALIDIHAVRGDHDAVIRYKRRSMASAGADEQVRLLGEIAELYRDALASPQRELAAYLEALEIAPHNHQLLQRVLDAYAQAGQWKRAVETIQRFLDIESNAQRRGRYYMAAAAISREELKQPDEALRHYELALDEFFDDPALAGDALTRAFEAFRAVDELLTEQKQWKEQERAYRRMIKRAGDRRELLVALWDGLVEVYRTRLEMFDNAMEAAEVAQSLDPGNTERRKLLAELYLVAGEQSPDKAAEQHQRILRTRPDAIDSYRMLGGIYANTQQHDRAWCAAAALAFLGKANAAEQALFERHRPQALVQAKGQLSDPDWLRLHHPTENRFITAIFGAIWRGPAMLRAAPLKASGLRRKDRIDVGSDERMVFRVIEYVARVLRCPVPDVYAQPDERGTLLLANAIDGKKLAPSLVVRADLLGERSRRACAFSVGRMLALLRPEHYLRLALPTRAERKVALLSAIKLVTPEFPVPPDQRDLVAEYLPAMEKHVSPGMREQLDQVVMRLLAAAPELDMDRWSWGVDATARRAGLVVSGDLLAAAKVIATEPTAMGEPTPQEKTLDLVVYSVSNEYFALRDSLGLAVR